MKLQLAAARTMPAHRKAMPQKAKFFCENCDNEVRSDAMVCPHCGRFFAAVRCPSCEHTGTNKDFLNGCPACGYAVLPKPKIVMRRKNGTMPSRHRNQSSSQFGYEDFRGVEEPLPLWVYGAVFLFAGVSAVAFTSFVL